MKKNRSALAVLLLVITVVLLGATMYISNLLSSSNSPTQIQKTKAAAVSYTRTVNLNDNFAATDPTPDPSSVNTAPTTALSPTQVPSSSVLPTKVPPLLAQAPTIVPTVVPTYIPVTPLATPTLSPLLAYKSISISPTFIPSTNTGVMTNPTTSPTKIAVQPTGVQQLPETGWIQTSSILFIVATSTILFSLLY